MQLSILTPTFNRLSNLKKNYEFIKKNKLIYDFEWIILYEDKDIKTKVFLKTIKEKYIKKIEGNFKSADKAYMHGFNVAKGKYITIHGDDDFFEENSFDEVFRALKYDKAWVVGQAYYVDKNYKKFRKFSTYIKNILLKINTMKLLPVINYVMTPSIFFKKKILFKLGGYNEEIKFGADYILWLKFNKFFKPKKIYKNISIVKFDNNTKTGSFDVERYIVFDKYMKKFSDNFLIRLLQIISTLTILIYNFFTKKIIRIY